MAQKKKSVPIVYEGEAPLIQPIDTWFEARRLGLLLEARVGSGKLVVCTMDLTSDLDQRPVARQFRSSLLHYLGSDGFDPGVDVGVEEILRCVMRET